MSLIPTRQVLPLTIVFLQAAAASSSGTILIFRIRGGSYGWRESWRVFSMATSLAPAATARASRAATWKEVLMRLLLVEPCQGNLWSSRIARALASLKPVDQLTRLVADGPCDHRLLAGGRSELFGNDLDLPDSRRFVWLARIASFVFHATSLPSGSSAVGSGATAGRDPPAGSSLPPPAAFAGWPAKPPPSPDAAPHPE